MKPFSRISVLTTLLIAFCFNLQSIFAESTDPQLLKGWDMYHNGKFGEAIELASSKTAQKQHNSGWDEIYALASCEQNILLVPDALNKIHTDIRMEPQNDHLLATGAILLANVTSHDNLLKLVNQPGAKINRQALSYATAAVTLAPKEARNHAALGVCLGTSNQTQDALAEIDKAIKLAPTDIEVNEMASRFYANVILDGKSSTKCYERLVKAYPNSLYLWKRLGNARETDGNPKGAIEAYSIAIQKDPKYLPALHDRYGVYHHTFQWEPAIKDATTLIALKEPSYGDRSFCYEKLHQYDKALADTTKYLVYLNRIKHLIFKNVGMAREDAYVPEFGKNDSDYARQFLTRPILYSKLGKYDKAIEELNPLIKADPLYAKALQCREFCYRKTFRYKEALADLNKLLIMAPTSELYTERADVYAHLGERSKVAYDIKRAHELALPLPP